MILKVKALIERCLVHVRETGHEGGNWKQPAHYGLVISSFAPGREAAVRRFVIVKGQTNLLEIVFALTPTRRFASLLHGRQEQRDQDGDNRDDHEQFNQSETTSTLTAKYSILRIITP